MKRFLNSFDFTVVVAKIACITCLSKLTTALNATFMHPLNKTKHMENTVAHTFSCTILAQALKDCNLIYNSNSKNLAMIYDRNITISFKQADSEKLKRQLC